jgi:hypothetical protein
MAAVHQYGAFVRCQFKRIWCVSRIKVNTGFHTTLLFIQRPLKFIHHLVNLDQMQAVVMCISNRTLLYISFVYSL